MVEAATMTVIIHPAASADLPKGLKTRFEVWCAGEIFTLGGFGHTAQRCSRIGAATSVRAHRSVVELPDSNAPFTGQHSRAEPFGKASSHKVEISGNLVKNLLRLCD
jgi:hypothetical protein